MAEYQFRGTGTFARNEIDADEGTWPIALFRAIVDSQFMRRGLQSRIRSIIALSGERNVHCRRA
jgi:hypothetical protein